MIRMNKYGNEATKPGQELYEPIYHFRRGERVVEIMYDYRTVYGELFSIMATTLEECRRLRDEWLAERNY